MAFKSIEDIIGQTVRRDISRMVGFAQGGLEHVARSTMSPGRQYPCDSSGRKGARLE
jgi:hypothetical protein